MQKISRLPPQHSLLSETKSIMEAKENELSAHLQQPHLFRLGFQLVLHLAYLLQGQVPQLHAQKVVVALGQLVTVVL